MTVFGLVMDIGGLWLKTTFVGVDTNAQVAETHDRVLGAVMDGEGRDANVVLSHVGIHIPLSLGVPRHGRFGEKRNISLTQLVSQEKVKKLFIRGMHSGTLELWYGEVDVAADADYSRGGDDVFAFAKASADSSTGNGGLWNAEDES
jgi:hypothetical protein|tara:strand:- start:1952 stop:2392 length:441 start_codon:yes stop_codon:yes gene_type:complete